MHYGIINSITLKRTTNMHEDEQRTFNDLQLPTMSLIEKFCQTPPEVKAYFVGILAAYEKILHRIQLIKLMKL